MIPLEDQIKEVRRELSMREVMYPRWIAEKGMDPATAERQIEIMKAVLASLKSIEGEWK